MEPSLPTKSPNQSPHHRTPSLPSFLLLHFPPNPSIHHRTLPSSSLFSPNPSPSFHLSVSHSLHHPTTASSNPPLHSKPISPSNDLNEFINNFNRTLGKGRSDVCGYCGQQIRPIRIHARQYSRPRRALQERHLKLDLKMTLKTLSSLCKSLPPSLSMPKQQKDKMGPSKCEKREPSSSWGQASAPEIKSGAWDVKKPDLERSDWGSWNSNGASLERSQDAKIDDGSHWNGNTMESQGGQQHQVSTKNVWNTDMMENQILTVEAQDFNCQVD